MTFKTEKLEVVLTEALTKMIGENNVEFIVDKSNGGEYTVGVSTDIANDVMERLIDTNALSRLSSMLLSYNNLFTLKRSYAGYGKKNYAHLANFTPTGCFTDSIKKCCEVLDIDYTHTFEISENNFTTHVFNISDVSDPLKVNGDTLSSFYLVLFSKFLGVKTNMTHTKGGSKTRIELTVPNLLNQHFEPSLLFQYVGKKMMALLIETDVDILFANRYSLLGKSEMCTKMNFTKYAVHPSSKNTEAPQYSDKKEKKMVNKFNEFAKDSGVKIIIPDDKVVRQLDLGHCDIFSVKRYLDLFTDPSNRKEELEKVLTAPKKKD